MEKIVAEEGASGKIFAVGAERATKMASDEEVGAMNLRIAAPAEESGIGITVKRSFFTAKLTNLNVSFHSFYFFNFPPAKERKMREKLERFGLVWI